MKSGIYFDVDVMSQSIVVACTQNEQCFDETFYLDQRSDQKLQMLVTKVAKEYSEQEHDG